MAHHHLWANTALLTVHCSETKSNKSEALQAEHRGHMLGLQAQPTRESKLEGTGWCGQDFGQEGLGEGHVRGSRGRG